ncbi:MAG: YbaN family protein, partial [Bacteroidia bacterium]|nr:YbaN family protein [Bacteroidia bacterium]
MKNILAFFGILSLVLGVIGMFLPVLPTTPFLLLSSYLFMKSSNRLYNWLMNHRILGPYIQDFMLHKTIPLHTKVVAITMLWV